MDRYQRVEKPRPDSAAAAAAAAENEIRVTTQGRMRSYITYATTLLQEKGADEVVFKAMGRAINKTVMIVELIKRRIVDLHQITAVGSMDITDYWEPLEEGLLPLETTRHVSMISITLSKKELDTSSIGYQNPIPHDQVKPLVDFDNEEGDAPFAGRGRGRGGRGRGRGRFVSGNGEIPVDYVDGGFDNRGGGFDNRGRGYGRGGFHGRGEIPGDYVDGDFDNRGGGFDNRGRGYGRGGFQGRGRGRGFQGRGRGGYGGRFDYQQETGDYEEAAPNPVPVRGRGRGRGPVRGRGRGFRGNGPNYAGRGGEGEQHE